MEKIKNKILTVLFVLLLSSPAFTQGPPPPPGEGGNGTPGQDIGNQNGNSGGAPIGPGIVILLSFGALYTGKKLYNKRKDKEILES